MNKKRFNLVFIGIILLFTFVFFWKVFLKNLIVLPADILVGTYYPWRDIIWNNLVAGVPIKNLELSDAISQFYPWKLFTINIFKIGQIPLWNHLTLSGSPFLATYHSAIFYPLNLLYFIVPNMLFDWNLQCFLQIFLSALFTFIFLRNLKIHWFGSLVGAFSFSLSGYMMNWLTFGPGSQAGLWLPLILLSIDKFKEKKSYWWFVLSTFSLLMMLLAGDFQTSFYSLMIIFVYGIWRRQFIFTILSLFFGFLLSSFQLLPTTELYNLSIRAEDSYIQQFNFGIIPWKKLIFFFAPDFFGNPTTGNFWGGNFYFGGSGYVGVLSLVLIFILLKNYRSKDVWFFTFISLVSLTFIFPFPWAKWPYLLKLPFLASSSANRMLFIPVFTFSVLASYGGDYLANNIKKINISKILRSLLPVWLIFVAILLAALISFVLFKNAQSSGVDITLGIRNIIVSLRNLAFPLLLLILSTILILFFVLTKKSFFLLIMILVLCFDLWRFGFKYTPFVDKDYVFPPTESIQWVKNQKGIFRVAGSIPSNFLMAYNIPSAEGYESIYPKRYSQFIGLVNSKNPNFGPGRYINLNISSPLINLLNVKYIFTLKKDAAGRPVDDGEVEQIFLSTRFKKVFEEKKTIIFENKESLPRGFLVFNYELVKSEKDLIDKMTKENFDFSFSVLLEEDLEDFYKDKTKNNFIKDVNFLSYTPNKIIIRTKSDRPGIFVLLDNFYPGWQAFVNREKTKIYRANYTFRAIEVPQGENQIEFIYQPQSFKIGLYLSGAALLLILTGWIIFWKRKKL